MDVKVIAMFRSPCRRTAMRQTSLGSVLALLITVSPTIEAAHRSPTPDRAVTLLADAFVAEYGRRFPFAMMEARLPLATQSGININAPQDLARWRRFVRSTEARIKRIPEAELIGRPAWVTRTYLEQPLRRNEATKSAARSYGISRHMGG